MQKQTTIWALSAADKIAKYKGDIHYQYKADAYVFDVRSIDESLCIVSNWNDKTSVAFRTAYAPGGITVDDVKESDAGAIIQVTGNTGTFIVEINFPSTKNTLLHYQVKFTPRGNLNIPYWPKDVLVFKSDGSLADTEGDLFVKQIGIRSGVLYAGVQKPGKGSFLYFQNLTAINEYCIETETSIADTVTGQWPEFGFSLPATKEKPLPEGKEFTIADAFVSFSTQTPADQFEVATAYIDHLAAIYQFIPRPDTNYQPYNEIIHNCIHDLRTNKGCWSQHKGCSYLNAYVCDYATPPEIMVQLAVLLPMWDYWNWSGEDMESSNEIYDNLETFYDEDIHTINRWLPAAQDMLDESEEQKVPYTMDSWYLHHPLLNLGRMALAGNEKGKKLFLNSIDYAIKVAHHFNYKWPVFYNMKTLETLKEETQPGMGGEKDVAGVYAQVMLMAYDLTGEKKYFKEAEKAAQSLVQFGFDIFYQANNVVFSTKAMLRLYKDTKKEVYLNLCHLLIANMLKNVALWECEYGYGKNFPLFFGLFPLNDAPYLAVYEEQECFASIHDLLEMAEGIPLSDNARLLLAEFVKYMINRAAYYCPPMLPKDMLSEEVKTGEIDSKLWIALEDMHDGWEKAGVVGQEVYGAGLCFGIVPRHYVIIPDQPFLVYVNYPTGKKQITGNTLTMQVLGNEAYTCNLRFVRHNQDSKLPEISVMLGNKDDQKNIDNSVLSADSDITIHGNQTIIIKWKSSTKKQKVK
ncbi:hypothetical protein ACFQZI_00340 [Mucilaginibacter lutimaris]|uniref:Alpha-L-rhamnosidase six-hairpin glycosidase domain-containing protein n=1 Tax=Mucilaginibacter lutimaris TaxID=931629 RepID=A0ABW2ZB73_9SPHI